MNNKKVNKVKEIEQPEAAKLPVKEVLDFLNKKYEPYIKNWDHRAKDYRNGFVHRYNKFSKTHEFRIMTYDIELPQQTLGFLMEIGKLFGTLDFHNVSEKESHEWRYSEYTGGTDHEYTHTFTIEDDKYMSGFPWDKKDG